MGRRLALAVARARPLKAPVAFPSVSLPALRAPSRRELAVAALVLIVLGLGYVGARFTPLFAVGSITVAGGPPEVAREVRASLDDVVGTSLVALDADEVERRVAALPSVLSADVDRAFPHDLAVVIEAERPLAVVRRGEHAWVIAETGRVIRELEGTPGPRLPRLRVRQDVSLRPGAAITGEDARAALDLLRALPRRFPVRILWVRASEGSVTAVVSGWVELRLGQPIDLEAKLAAAAAVLRSLPEEERAEMGYLDVAVPQRPVGALKSQVESES
jgi:cell division protein FtsQ